MNGRLSCDFGSSQVDANNAASSVDSKHGQQVAHHQIQGLAENTTLTVPDPANRGRAR